MSVLPIRTYGLMVMGVFGCSSFLLTPPTRARAQERESIFDRVVHLEPGPITEIPPAPRWEEALGIEGRRIHVRDAEIWVEEEGSGIPLVLINGGPGGTHHVFHPWFGRAAEFARVVYYDQRGCGLSDYEPGPDGYSVEQAVQDLEGLRKALGLGKVVLAGFSYGGFLAQYYTTTYPQHVAGLVLVGASPQISANLGQSRQQEFISPEERARMQEVRAQLRELAAQEEWTPEKLLALTVYNNHINGDWKRQHFFKPSTEAMAQIALYEWVQDGNFNSLMGQSAGRVDLTGAFDTNPIPTLILEGEWDLTWGPEKRTALAANHPNGRMVTFQRAGHSIFDEDPDGFFTTLRDFIHWLAPVDPEAISAYQSHLSGWREAWMASPAYRLRAVDWGLSASKEIAEAHDPGWLAQVTGLWEFFRLGFALYDVERYEEALTVFSRMRDWSRSEGNAERAGIASIWAAHMLDLLGRRSEAISLYQEVADLHSGDTWTQDQYGLRIVLSPYAEERLGTPFRRIENRLR